MPTINVHLVETIGHTHVMYVNHYASYHMQITPVRTGVKLGSRCVKKEKK